MGPPHDGGYNILSPTFDADGACLGDWRCEHRWRQIANMVEFRNVVAGTALNDWWDNGNNQIAFCRGGKGFVAFNNEGYALSQTLQVRSVFFSPRFHLISPRTETKNGDTSESVPHLASSRYPCGKRNKHIKSDRNHCFFLNNDDCRRVCRRAPIATSSPVPKSTASARASR